jgi:very-short-patch-repair endonuclease
VDVIAHAKKLSIEIEGEQHFAPGQMQRDERREPLLAANPFRVLRFNNNDVIADRTGALEAILSALARGKAPSPPSAASRDGGAITGFQQ